MTGRPFEVRCSLPFLLDMGLAAHVAPMAPVLHGAGLPDLDLTLIGARNQCLCEAPETSGIIVIVAYSGQA